MKQLAHPDTTGSLANSPSRTHAFRAPVATAAARCRYARRATSSWPTTSTTCGATPAALLTSGPAPRRPPGVLHAPQPARGRRRPPVAALAASLPRFRPRLSLMGLPAGWPVDSADLAIWRLPSPTPPTPFAATVPGARPRRRDQARPDSGQRRRPRGRGRHLPSDWRRSARTTRCWARSSATTGAAETGAGSSTRSTAPRTSSAACRCGRPSSRCPTTTGSSWAWCRRPPWAAAGGPPPAKALDLRPRRQCRRCQVSQVSALGDAYLSYSSARRLDGPGFDRLLDRRLAYPSVRRLLVARTGRRGRRRHLR